ncbi:helix-turn-helix transcriptional regulator [Streptomyces sp. NPDC059740]|uniref:helix-turn-helix transcriptional regulator n=1 Tax=Streptomyces sp. NPDC059740 TaxID=3346926 RepID=UPI0036611B1C
MHSSELGEFLRSRRARIRPEDCGLPAFGRRRVPGLRREEVAQLAGVSVDYYVRLEQGRGASVSDAVLDAVARVLRLDATEHGHLRDLVRADRRSPALHRPPGSGHAAPVREGVRVLLDAVGAAPAFVLGRRMDVLAWNALGDAVVGFSGMPARRRNMACAVFLDPAAREVYPDWESVAADTVAHLRLDAGRHPGDRRTDALVSELSASGPDFVRLWNARQVKEKTHGTKRMCHPQAGELHFGFESLALPGDPDQTLVVYTAPAGTDTADRLDRLAAHASGERTGEYEEALALGGG